MKLKNIFAKFNRAATLLPLLVFIAFGANPPAAVSQIKVIITAWNQNVYDERERVGERFGFDCPPGDASYSIYGTDVYTYDSSVCTAAVHAGLITAERGGRGTLEIVAGQDSYQATTRNGVTSRSYGKYGASYRFIKPDEAKTPTNSNSATDKVLVKGNPSLMQSDVGKVGDYYEWLFDTKLTNGERAALKDYIVANWSNKEIHNYVRALSKGAGIVAAMDEAARAQRRDKLLPQFVADFEKLPNDPLNKIVKPIYERTQNSNAAAENNAATMDDRRSNKKETEIIGGDGLAKDLIGAWGRNRSGTSYVTGSGVYAGSSGNSESYTFHADGRVEYTSYIVVQNYGCRTEVFTQRTGRYSVDGDSLTTKFSPSTVRYEDCRKTYTKPLVAADFTNKWRIKRENNTVSLCLAEPNGAEFCHVKSEK